MGKPRANLPTLARSSATPTCIDTNNVSRNPIFTPSSPFFSGQPLVSLPLSQVATNSHGFNILTLKSSPCPSFGSIPSTPPSFLHHNHSVPVGNHQDSWPSQPWHISFSGPPPKPLPEGKERAALWKKLTPAEQDDLLYERVDFYDLKAKYDALEKLETETPIVTVESNSQCDDTSSTVSPVEETCADHIELAPNDSDSGVIDLEQSNSTITSFPVDDDVLNISDFETEDESEPATSSSVVRGRLLGSGPPVVRHRYKNVTYFRHSSIYDEDEKIRDVKIAPLYNFKKRRRK